MSCEGYPLENYSFFVLGSLPEDESSEIRSHLDSGCEVCRLEVQRSEGVWYAVALSAAPMQPRRALRRRVRAMVRPAPAGWFGWAWPFSPWSQMLAAASLVVIAVLAAVQTAVLHAHAQELEQQVSEYKVLLAAARRKLESNLQLATLIANPDVKLMRLQGTAPGGGAAGHALVTAGSQVYFYASQLPALPAGRVYQLWLIRSQSPAVVSAGTFTPDASNQATLQFANGAVISGITAMAVTDEPAGGSAGPTGQKFLVGQWAPA